MLRACLVVAAARASHLNVQEAAVIVRGRAVSILSSEGCFTVAGTPCKADVQETRRQAEIMMMGACDREALQAERHALATRVAELEKQLAAFTPQVTAPSSRAGSMDITAA